MDMIVQSYLNQGFSIESQNDTQTILIKKKKPINKLMLILLLFTFVGALIYLAYYFAVQKDERILIQNGMVSKL